MPDAPTVTQLGFSSVPEPFPHVFSQNVNLVRCYFPLMLFPFDAPDGAILHNLGNHSLVFNNSRT